LPKVAILNPEHLMEQADKLIAPPPAGPPRQVDLRRAISAAYYAVFHATVAAAADQFVGITKRATNQYGLVYRAVDHRWLRSLCEDVKKPTSPTRYVQYAPTSGFGPDIIAFATAVADLQQRRHAADYDSMVRVKSADAILAATTARAALQRLQSASPSQREAFLSLLLFPPRS
jgi:hypothetical protein